MSNLNASVLDRMTVEVDGCEPVPVQSEEAREIVAGVVRSAMAIDDASADFENAGLTLGVVKSGDSPNWSILSELTDDQVNACYDWLENVPQEGGEESDKEARVEWRASAPKFIRFTGATSPATADAPERDVIEFVLPESIEKKLKRLEIWKRKIEQAESDVRNQSAEVISFQSKVDEAKGELKAAKERWEQLVCVMQQVITDAKSGQQSLPFPDPDSDAADSSTANAAATASNATDSTPIPLSVLLVKNIRETVGVTAFESAKNSEDPIGLSQVQLDKLETACESSTLGGLEKWISGDPWWHDKITGFGDKAITRLISTIAAYRRVHPMVVE